MLDLFSSLEIENCGAAIRFTGNKGIIDPEWIYFLHWLERMNYGPVVDLFS